MISPEVDVYILFVVFIACLLLLLARVAASQSKTTSRINTLDKRVHTQACEIKAKPTNGDIADVREQLRELEQEFVVAFEKVIQWEESNNSLDFTRNAMHDLAKSTQAAIADVYRASPAPETKVMFDDSNVYECTFRYENGEPVVDVYENAEDLRSIAAFKLGKNL